MSFCRLISVGATWTSLLLLRGLRQADLDHITDKGRHSAAVLVRDDAVPFVQPGSVNEIFYTVNRRELLISPACVREGSDFFSDSGRARGAVGRANDM